MSELSNKDLRRLRNLEDRLARVQEEKKVLSTEKGQLKRELAKAERTVERFQAIESQLREKDETLGTERKSLRGAVEEERTRVKAVEDQAKNLTLQISSLLEENRRLAESLADLQAFITSMRKDLERAQQEAADTIRTRNELEQKSEKLQAEVGRVKVRLETAEAQLRAKGVAPVLPAEEVAHLLGELVEQVRSGLQGLSVREGEVKLKVAFSEAGQARGFVVPTLHTEPGIKESLHELSLKFNQSLESSLLKE